MVNLKNKWKKMRLSLLFSAVFFAIMLLTMFLVFAGIILLDYLGFISSNKPERLPLFLFAIVSLIVGTILSVFLSHKPLAPLREIMEASDKIASGDYSARIHLKGPEEFKQLNISFNHMAEELGSVEILRNDFVHNFSHEFKTPIVSIRGFAKILKYNDISPEEKTEYLDIIMSESERLAELATNVLQLSKLEQQTILTGQKNFNVSEQIRLVIAMLDQKWSKKHIDIIFDSHEIYFYGNEELLQQVWINLIDNAIKFSPDYGAVQIKATESEGNILVTVSDQGDGMSPDTAKHIFDKFYQGNTTHTTQGNGLGLNIADRILQLHEGKIIVKKTNNEGTDFQVSLPQTRNI